MLTLKELKKIVKVADVEKRIPSVKSLKEHKVVVKEMINADTTISVYDHGYVLYTAGNQSTVFPLHSCDDYEYVSVTGDNKEFKGCSLKQCHYLLAEKKKAVKTTPCSGCPYGKHVPCIGYCIARLHSEMKGKKGRG